MLKGEYRTGDNNWNHVCDKNSHLGLCGVENHESWGGAVRRIEEIP